MRLFTSQLILMSRPLITRNRLALSQTSFKVRPRVTVLDRENSLCQARILDRSRARRGFPAPGTSQGSLFHHSRHFDHDCVLTGLYTSSVALSRICAVYTDYS